MNSYQELPEVAQWTTRRPLRIALLGYRSHPFVGGQGIYIRYLSKALKELGHEVDVISGPPYPELPEGVRLVEMPSLDLFAAPNHVTALRWKHLRSWTDFYEWFITLTGGFVEPYTFGRRVVKYMKEHGHEYDIVHDNQSLCYGLLELQEMGIPTVATIHHPITRDRDIAVAAAPNWRLNLLVRRWYSFLRMQKRVVQKLKHKVTVSAQSRKDIAEAFEVPADDIELIYNGIDTEVFRPMPDVKVKPFRIMTTSSSDQPLKGLRYLLEAVASLKQQMPQIELLIVGALKEGGQTEKLLNKLDLHDHVRFVSKISTEELVRYYAEAAVVVTPSLYEGFGLPAGEAMACGCAVVSANGGALPEVVGDAGIVVEAADSEALAAALQRVLSDEVLRKSLEKVARQRIVEQFSWRLVAERLSDYYGEMVDEQADLLEVAETC